MAWWLVSGGGGLLFLFHCSQLLRKPTFVATGLILVPTIAALGIAGAGYWLRGSQLREHATRVGGWTLVGGTAGGVTGIGGLLYQKSQGLQLVEPSYVVLSILTFGAFAGLLVGWFDARQRQHLKQLRQREKALQRERDRMEEFASVVSHDLRNPLNVAEGYVNMLEVEDEEPIARIKGSLRRMDQIIDDVLTLAQQDQRIQDVESVALSEVVNTCWNHVDTRSADLTVEADVTVEADRSRLQQLLENLLGNAIDHAGEDVTVRIGALDNGFFVEDDGPGLPDQDYESIFAPGYSTTENGTGLGLTIVRKIAEAHGWTVTATEGERGGVRFEITGVKFAAETV